MGKRIFMCLATVVCLGYLLTLKDVSYAATPTELGTKYEALDPSLWSLTWNDEFSTATLDTTKWSYVEGGGGYGNNEQENYTSRTNNIRIENGKLIIQAIPESYGDESYTSAKITTQGKADWTYGKYEFRAKLPKGQGLWPAIWMLPADISTYGGVWPICGEMDIMEYMGSQPGVALGTIHYGNPWVYTSNNYTLASGASYSDAFHTFTMEWLPGEIRWYVDGNLYQIQQNWYSVANDGTSYAYPAPFNQDFYLIMNLAVGGFFPGAADESTWTETTFQIDYVRVYQYTGDLTAAQGGNQQVNVNLLSNSNFDSTLNGWSTWTENGSTFANENNTLKANISATLPNAWSSQVYQQVKIVAGTPYRLQFKARSSMNRQIKVALEGANYSTLYDNTFNVTSDWTNYTLDFTPTVGFNAAKLIYFLGNVGSTANAAHTVYFDDITLMPYSNTQVVANGNFADGLTDWSTWTENSSQYSYNTSEGCFQAYIPTTLPNAWSAQLYQLVDLVAGKTYQISFRAKSSVARQITAAIEKANMVQPLNQTLNVTTGWQTFTYTFTTSAAYNDAKLVFMLGNVGTTSNTAHNVYIDDITISAVN